MSVTAANLLQLSQGPLIPRIVAGLVALLMCWWAVANVLPMFYPDDTADIIKPVTIIDNSKTPEKTTVTDLDLFGTVEINKTSNNVLDAKPTKLNLTLRGILATDDPKVGIAQIQDAKKNEKHFIVGDSVFGKASLEEVYVDRVILLHNGRYETLLLPEEFLNANLFAAAKLRQERKRVATNYRDIFLSRQGSELIKLFGFRPQFRQGTMQGFKVIALGDKGREMMSVLGIEDGDLIVEVNGLRFSESLEASAQLKDLKDATEVDVIISRNGEELPFHVEFDKRVEEVVQIPEGITKEEYEHQQIMAEPDFGDTEEEQEYLEQQKKFRAIKPSSQNYEYDH